MPDQEDAEVLSEIAQTTKAMAEGQFNQKLNIEAKGELGELARSINQTLINLQQLDVSIKGSSEEVPQLTAQLDKISKDTEKATNDVLSKLESILASVDKEVKEIQGLYEYVDGFDKIVNEIDVKYKSLLLSLKDNRPEEKEKKSQNIIRFLSYVGETNKKQGQYCQKVKEKIGAFNNNIKGLQTDCYNIMDLLQFQDITRQKTDRIILLLKEMEKRLKRLLIIFNIQVDMPADNDAEHVRVSKHIENVSLEADAGKEKVDNIIDQFNNSTSK
ncbi:MAG: protein phosphatase CheZ [bacterium]